MRLATLLCCRRCHSSRPSHRWGRAHSGPRRRIAAEVRASRGSIHHATRALRKDTPSRHRRHVQAGARPPQRQPSKFQARESRPPSEEAAVAALAGRSTVQATGSGLGGLGSGLAGPPYAASRQLAPTAMAAVPASG